MKELLIPLGLVGLGIFFLITEAFIPSAGVLGVLSVISLVSGMVAAFYLGGLTVGTVFMTVTCIGVGGMVAYLVRKWPETTLGKLILVEPAPEATLLPDRSELHAMVGRVGQALSLMLPSGFVEIDGKRYDAAAQTSVEQGTWVKVLSVRHGRILMVQPISEEAAFKAQKEVAREQDPLAMPVEEVLRDPFEDPLG